MEDFFAGLFAVILFFYLFITGPIYNNFAIADNYIDNHIRTASTQFQKQVRNNGYIDLETYNKFLQELSRTRKPYKVEIVHGSKLIYPKGINDYQTVFIDHGNQEIFNEIYKKKSKYLMKYGDSFKVTVTETQEANSRVLLKSFKNIGANRTLLSFSTGGMIENEIN